MYLLPADKLKFLPSHVVFALRLRLFFDKPLAWPLVEPLNGSAIRYVVL